MSEVAGKLAIQAGATHLQKNNGGRGVLLGGVTGVPPAKVVVIGGGTVGTNAAKVAVGIGARTVVMDKSAERLTYLDDIFGGRIETVLSTEAAIEEEIEHADLVVGAVLLPGGAQAPHLIKRSMLKNMLPGSVLVDVAIDQGGCFETSKPTTHTDPTYVVDGVIHYCVANMPGAVARTSTMALAGATLPVRPRHRQQGLRAGRQGRCRARARRQRLPWQAHHPVGGRGSPADVHAAGQSAGVTAESAPRRPLAAPRRVCQNGAACGRMSARGFFRCG